MNHTTDQADNQGFHLILGGARSGKSAFAEQAAQSLARQFSTSLVYVATATAQDDEMFARIAHHQQQRLAYWQTVETPLHLASSLAALQHQQPQAIILVDCLTLWLTNCLLHPDPHCWERERHALLSLLPTLTQPILLVSNEVGWGIVPMGELSRRFVDEAGRLHQALAAHARRVSLVVAGIPLTVK